MSLEQKTKTRIAGIVIQNGKVLFVRGKGYSELWTPGGKVELNETDEECLRRELREEISVNLLDCKFFKEYKGRSYYHIDEPLLQRVYVVSVEGDIKPDAEIESFLWLSKEEFDNRKELGFVVVKEEIFNDLIKEKIW